MNETNCKDITVFLNDSFVETSDRKTDITTYFKRLVYR